MSEFDTRAATVVFLMGSPVVGVLANTTEVDGLGWAITVTGWACAGFLASIGGEFNFGNDPGVGTIVGLVGSSLVAMIAIALWVLVLNGSASEPLLCDQPGVVCPSG